MQESRNRFELIAKGIKPEQALHANGKSVMKYMCKRKKENVQQQQQNQIKDDSGPYRRQPFLTNKMRTCSVRAVNEHNPDAK